jgi:putative transposase
MKPNTFTKLYVHCIFAPRGRSSLLSESVRTKTYKYIYGIIKEKKCNPIAINGTDDHVHLLIGFNPMISISDLIRDIKRSSAMFINANHLLSERFNWQEGFGAFTVGHKELDNVYKYVLNQNMHHLHNSFKDEYSKTLSEEGIDFSDSYLFEFYPEI